MASKRALIEQIRLHAQELAKAANTATTAAMTLLGESDRRLKQQLEEIQARGRSRLAESKQAYDTAITNVRKDLSLLDQQAGPWGAPWEAGYWDEYHPAAGPPLVARAGVFNLNGAFTRLTATAYFRFTGGRNLIIKGPGETGNVACGLLQSLLWRLVLTSPPSKLRMLLIDPEGSGQNVAGLMPLGRHMEELITSRAWTEPVDIERKLADISLHMETVIQKFLQNQYPSIEDYNAKAGEIAEPYRVVGIFNYPFNFNDESGRRLVSIANNGPRCGVYTLMTVNTDRRLPYNTSLADLERNATVIAWNGSRWVWQDDDCSEYQEFEFVPDTSPPQDRMIKLMERMGPMAKEASVVRVPFERMAPDSEQCWKKEKTANGIKVSIGRSGARDDQIFELGTGTAAHALIAGRTGSGKSTFMHVLILSLAMTYNPEELELYLVDFKKGVEFKDYAPLQNRPGLPHARVVAIESEREFGLSCLAGLVTEMERRGDLFRVSGASNLTEYRTKTGDKKPRILLLVDEFHEFFLEDDALARQAAQCIERLARESRAFGIHMVLASQNLTGIRILPRSVLDQMAVRIALQCSDTDSRLILADTNDAARMLTRPGEAIYNASNGLKEGNHLFQIGWLTDEERTTAVRALAELDHKSYGDIARSTTVFEGNAAARLEDSGLERLLTTPPISSARAPIQGLLGQPIAIKDATSARFLRQTGRNLLIVGREENVAIALVLSSLFSIAAATKPETCSFYIADLSSPETPFTEILQSMSSLFPHSLRFAHRRDLPPMLSDLRATMAHRVESDHGNHPALFFFGIGLHRAKDLTRDMSFSIGQERSGPNPGEDLAAILQGGSEVGIHVVGWWDSRSSVSRAVDPRTLSEFGIRVAMPMSSEDSSQLLDSAAAARLGAHRGLLMDEERPGYLEKFIPYGIPAAEWLRQFCRKLKQERGN